MGNEKVALHWTDQFKVGIEIIDEQHRKLVDLTNAVFSKIMDPNNEEDLSSYFKELNDYCHYHFETEEKLLTETSWPDLDDHKLLHSKLFVEVEFLQAIFAKENDKESALTLLKFLKEWLQNHISVEDKLYAQHLHEHNIT